MSKKIILPSFFFLLMFAFVSEMSASSAQNERLVVTSLRKINSAQATFAATVGNGNYASLAQLAQENLIDQAQATGVKYGYVYQISLTAANGATPAAYTVVARPSAYRKSGRKSFYIDQSGVLRGADKSGGNANVGDPIIDSDCVPFEECAITSLRTLFSAEITYAATVGNGNYASFEELYNANLISSVLRIGFRAGYTFQYTFVNAVPGVQPARFTLRATPAQYGGGTRRSFFIDESGVLRGADKMGEPADANDPPIEN